MKNQFATHLVYCSVIFCLVVALCISSAPNLIRWYFYRGGTTFMKIDQDIKIIDPETRSPIGILYRGAVLQSPSIEDLRDTDLGDNDRWKILINATAVPRERREYTTRRENESLPIHYSYDSK